MSEDKEPPLELTSDMALDWWQKDVAPITGRVVISAPVFDVHGQQFVAVPVDLFERVSNMLGATPHEDDGFWTAENKADMIAFRALRWPPDVRRD